jgi:hypothetical protein
MIDPLKERLYRLLPAIYRQRDPDYGYALRTLMNAFESEFQLLETDMDSLYHNWFIETAADWVIPYIGELLDVTDLSEKKKLFFSQRRRVANTIGYRRRKGIPAVLEHVVQDVTGWPARMIEYKQFLAMTQHMAHIQPDRGKTIDLRQASTLAGLDGPFDRSAHTVDVRHIGTNTGPSAVPPPYNVIQGKYQPHNLGLFLWRLQSYQMTNVPAGVVTHQAGSKRLLPAGCFTFDPLRRDLQLFTLSQEITAITDRIEASNVPAPITRADFANDLAAYNACRPEEQGANSLYYGPDSSLYIVLNGRPVQPSEIVSADLSYWQPPVRSGKQVAVDVVLGRIVVLAPKEFVENKRELVVETTYCYGFSSEIGGGPYIRELPPTEAHVIDIRRGSAIGTLQKAFAAWDDYCRTTSKPRATIRILDNRTYAERDLILNLPTNSRLTIEATHGLRPTINPVGNLDVRSAGKDAHLILNGLLIHCPLRLQGDLQLDVAHCAVAPYGIETSRTMPNDATLQLTIDHCIIGPLRLQRGRGTLHIQDSIIDAFSAPHAITTLLQYPLTDRSSEENLAPHPAAPDGDHFRRTIPSKSSSLAPGTEHLPGIVTQIERATIFGVVQLQEVSIAREVIFTAPVFVRKQHTGQISFSYVPNGSQTSQQDRCLPNLATLQDHQTSPAEPLRPLFTSTCYGDAGYAQLSALCPMQIRRGAESGSEMGVFHDLRHIQRQDNLYHVLDEFFPFEFATSIFYPM